MLYPNARFGIITAAFLLITVATSRAQLLTSYLQNSSVNGIACEDSTCNLFFATTTGLWKFDGKDFKLVPITVKLQNNPVPQPVNPGELADVIFDNDKRIWIGSQTQGLFVKNGAIWQHITSASGAPSNNITDLYVDQLGRVWVGTVDQGVGIWVDSTWHRIKAFEYAVFQAGQWIIKANLPSSRGLRDNIRVNVICDDKDGIWIGTPNTVVRFSGSAIDSANVNRSTSWCYCLSYNILSFAKSLGGKTWAGTGGNGVFQISSGCAARRCSVLDSLKTENARLQNNFVNDMEVDDDGNLWFGTNDGVCRYNLQAQSFRCLNQDNFPGLRTVKSVFKDTDNNLWFGLLESLGVIRLNNNWITFDRRDTLNPFVQSLLVVKDTLWVGTANGIRRLKDEARVGNDILPGPNNEINALAAENSKVWAGTFGAGVYLYNGNGAKKDSLDLNPTKTRTCNNQVNQLLQRNGELWIATEGVLARRLSNRSLKFYENDTVTCFNNIDRFRAVAFDKKGLLWCGTPLGVRVLDTNLEQWVANYTTANGLFEDNNVTAIAANPANEEIWIGTTAGGISIYDNGKWRQLDRRTVLADNFVNEIVFSNSGEVYVATPRGVSRRDTEGLWTTFDFQSGLASDNVASVALQGDSLIWFGTYGAGLTRYRPPQSKPQTFIETRLDVTDKPEVTYRFSAADLNTTAGEFRYRFWLDNDPPSEPISDRFAVVKGVDPGPHTFYVQAIDRDGNLDPMPDTDFFTRIPPALGGSSIITDTSFHEIGPITVSVYWPPNLLKENTTIIIEPDTAIASTLFAFRLTSSEAFQLRKPITLTFSFPDTGKKLNNFRADSLGIFKIEGNRFLELGGAYSSRNKMISISTVILELGFYAVQEREKPAQRTAASDSLQKAFHVSAQPRIIRRDDLQTTISFRLDQAAQVRVQVYNLAGRLVGTIWDEFMQPGINAVPWNGKDKNGYPCPPGLYLITLQSDGFKPPPKPVKVMVLNK